MTFFVFFMFIIIVLNSFDYLITNLRQAFHRSLLCGLDESMCYDIAESICKIMSCLS